MKSYWQIIVINPDSWIFFCIVFLLFVLNSSNNKKVISYRMESYTNNPIKMVNEFNVVN